MVASFRHGGRTCRVRSTAISAAASEDLGANVALAVRTSDSTRTE